MPIYLEIQYTYQAHRVLPSGKVELDVEFNRGTIYKYSTFVFNNEQDATDNWRSRSENKIDRCLEKRTRKLTYEDIGERLFQYFSNPENTNLTRSAAVAWYRENIGIEGAI